MNFHKYYNGWFLTNLTNIYTQKIAIPKNFKCFGTCAIVDPTSLIQNHKTHNHLHDLHFAIHKNPFPIPVNYHGLP